MRRSRARVSAGVDPDTALVAAAREEPQAFPALYDRYFERVLGYVRLRIRDESTCEDIASTVFTTALAQPAASVEAGPAKEKSEPAKQK